MRKFNFDNLAILNGEYDLRDQLLIDAVTAPSLDINLFAPQPGPLFATINGTPGDDVLNGTSGDDILIGGAGNDIINGGDGVDIAVFSASGDYRVIDLGNGDAYVRMLYEVGDGLDLLTGIETLRFDGINGTDFDLSTLAVAADINGTIGDDTLTATGGDIVLGFAGNDTITGTNLSSAEIYAGAGDDIVTTGSGSSGDFIFVYGDVGNDTLNIGRVNFGTIEGGDGNDILNIDFSTNSIVNGGAGDDTFNITDAFDTFFSGGAGNDDVEFSFQNATSVDLTGGAGIDTLRTSMDFEELDTINRFGGTIDITNNVTAGDYSELTLSGGFEVLIATGGGETDTLRGGSGNDVLEDGGFWAEDEPGAFYYGNGGNDFLYGMAGDDVIIGTGGQDVLSGGEGDDIITSGGHYVQGYTDSFGNSFSETIISRATMIGGEGNDVLNSYGVDTAIYSSSNASDYTITEISAGVYTVEAVGGTAEGIDTLIGIEMIRLGGIDGIDYDIGTLAMAGDTNLTNGDDTYTSRTDEEIVNGLDGDDILYARGQLITLNGDGGNDRLFDKSGYSNTLNGGAGADYLNVQNYFSGANGDDGDDEIFISHEGSFANGGAGNDTITAIGVRDFGSAMTVDGGSGFDTLIVTYDVSLDSDNENFFGGALNMSTGLASGDYNFLTSISGFERLEFQGGGDNDNITGTDGDDILDDGGFYGFYGGTGAFFGGQGGNDVLNGGGGNDTIIGRGGIDTLSGGDGNDTITSGSTETFTFNDLGDTGSMTREAEALISGGAGDDIIISRGNDTIDGGDGDDIILMGRSGRDTVTTTEGGAGIDTLSFSNLSLGSGGASFFLVVDLQGQSYSLRNTDTNTVLFVDTFGVFENATGSEYRDLLQGDGLDNVLQGLGGDDALQGRAGMDTAVYASANAEDYLITETGVGEYTIESIGTDEGTDTLTGIETIRLGGVNGTDYDIAVLANTGITLDGTSGNDTLNGTPGDDILNGLGGSDIFNGFAGNDIFIADFSDLEFNGGEGYDEIRFDFEVDGSGDSTFLIDFRDYDIDSIEEITLNPTLAGGGAGSATYFFEIGTSQFDQLQRFDAVSFADTQIFYDGANTLDLTDFYLPGANSTFTVYGSPSTGVDFTLTFDQEKIEYFGGAGQDIIIGLQDATQFWYFTADGGSQSTSLDTIDFSQMATVAIGSTATRGQIIYDLSNNIITQTGFFLDTDSFASVTNFEAFIGWDGRDIFIGDESDNTFIGNAGDNVAVYSSSNILDYAVNEIAPGQYTVEAIGGTSEGTDTLTDVQTVRLGGVNGTDYDIDYLVSIAPIDLTNGDDVYVGTSDDNIVNGLDGDDIISGEDGNDTLNGDGGNDVLRGGNGNDILNGGDGDDTLFGGYGSDIFDGGAGIDTVSYDNFGDEVTIDLLTGTASDGASGDSFVSIENVTGSAFQNILRGDSNDNVLTGGDVNDTLQGRNGNDTLIGGFGDDRLDGGRGEDVLFGQEGDDSLNGRQGTEVDDDYAVYISTDPIDYVVTYLGGITYSVQSIGTGEGTDILTSIEFIRLGGLNGTDYDISMFPTGNGEIDLTTGNDVYSGTAADEVVNALAGDDVFDGGTGNNTLNGDAGNDTLISLGNDVLNGGTGNDTVEMGGNVFDVATATDGGADIDTISFSTLAQLPSGNLFLVLDLNGEAYSVRVGSTVLYVDQFTNFENATGTEFGDLLQGDAGANTLSGLGGDDTLQGRDGDDIINGGAGSDTAIYSSASVSDYTILEISAGVYTVEATGSTTEGLDTLTNVEFLCLGGTTYAIETLAGGGTITLTTGNDIYSGGSSNVIVNALAGDDIIDGGTADNTLNGDAGDDTLISLGNDILNGGTGNDTVEMGGNVFDAATTTDGGADIDTISFSTLAQFPSGNLFLVLDLNGQAYSVRDGGTVLYVDQFTNFENATGSEFGDLLQGDAGANVLSGLGGDDNLQGRDGNDIIDGGAGADILNGDVGTDTASYASAFAGVMAIMGDAALNTGDAVGDSYIDIENITGSDFDDILGGDANANIIDGGAGFDIASYVGSSAAIVFDGLGLIAASGDITADTLLNIEGIGGSDFNDRFYGDNGASIFYGGEGADRLFGRNGDDELYGEGGNDIILAGRDNDVIDGGAGNDQLRGNEGDDTIFGGDGNDAITGGAGADAMDGGAGIDRVEYTYGTNAGVTASLGDSSINTGDAAGDTYVNIENLYGTTFVDTLYGDASNNRIDGRGGDDMLFGGDGNDYVIGGAGNDVLNGEGGNDLYLGQAGADIYQFDAAHGTDRLIIFTQGEDLIEFTEGVFDFNGLTITQDGAHVNILTSEGTIIANNALVADFTAADFIFASPPSQEPLQEPLDMMEQDMAMFVEVDVLI